MRQLKYRIPILILLFAAALAGFFYRSQKTGDASGQAVRTALEPPGSRSSGRKAAESGSTSCADSALLPRRILQRIP